MLRRAIELAPKRDRLSGDGVIRGTATFRGEQTPAAGVVVLATAYPLSAENVKTDYAKPAIREAYPGPRWKRSPPGGDAFWRLHYALREELYEMSRTYKAVTSADGTYELAGLPGSDGKWTFGFQVYSPDGEAKLERDKHGPGASTVFRDFKVGDTVDILVAREYVVPYNILMPDGSPAEGAWAYASGPKAGPSSYTGSQWWSVSPTRTLVAGEYTVWAEMDQLAGLPGKGDRFRMRSNSTEITVGAGSVSAPVVLKLEGLFGVRVVVRDPGKVNRYFKTKVLQLENGKIPESVDAQRGWTVNPTKLDSGDYVADFTGIDPGSYAAAIIEDDVIVASEYFTLGEEVKIIEFALPPPARHKYVVAWIYGPDGKLLDDVDITTSIEFQFGEGTTGSGMFHDSGSWRREDGAWCAIHAPYNRKVAGASKSLGRLCATSSEFGKLVALYEYSAESECTLRFEQPGSISVTLRNVKGHSHVAAMRVQVTPTNEDRGGRELSDWLSSYTNIPDSTTFDSVPVGTYTVSLRCQTNDYGEGGLHILDSVEVTVGSRKAEAILTAPALYNLTISVPNISTSYALKINLKEGKSGTSVSASRGLDEKRTTEVRGLVEGVYTISASSQFETHEYPAVEVKVPSTGPVVFDPKAFDAIEVSWLKDDTHMYRAGFRQFDIVIGTAGNETKNLRDLRRILKGDESDQSIVQIAILRSGKPQTISISRSDLAADDSGYSVNLEPCHRDE